MSTFRRLTHATLLPSLALATGLLTALPALAAGTVPYSGTSKADKIDFRSSGKNYSIKGLGGNDLIYSGYGNDKIDGGQGTDTING